MNLTPELTRGLRLGIACQGLCSASDNLESILLKLAYNVRIKILVTLTVQIQKRVRLLVEVKPSRDGHFPVFLTSATRVERVQRNLQDGRQNSNNRLMRRTTLERFLPVQERSIINSNQDLITNRDLSIQEKCLWAVDLTSKRSVIT